MISNDAPLSDGDRQAILATAADYIESWMDGDADRMARCLHPGLAKRAVYKDETTGEWVLDESPRDMMVDETAAGHGRRMERPYEIRLLDAYDGIADVAVFSSAYMDYLHIARVGDRWLIVNAPWQRRLRPDA
jgi:hypothetical protein